MTEYEVKCPVCGKVNKRLYLEETNGYMECEKCGSLIKTDYYGQYSWIIEKGGKRDDGRSKIHTGRRV